MAKPSQTFKKRQREHKLRERAQLKRERRQQRQMERKTSHSTTGAMSDADPGQAPINSASFDEATVE
jgi:hypothetical protein